MDSGAYELFYQDECHFKLTLTIVRAWFLKGITPQIKSPTDRFKISVFGAMGRNGQFIVEAEDNFDADTFQRFLQALINRAATDKKILLVLDNASYHHAKKLKDYLDSVEHKLELFFLPAYSPDLNAIEMFWKKTRRAVTHNRYFPKLRDITDALFNYWEQFMEPNEELANLCAFI